MSKTKAFLTLSLLVLLGSMGAAQAQTTLAKVTLLTATERAAREGGKQEAAGDVFLDIEGVTGSIASYTLTYSVPVVLPDPGTPRATSPLRATWKKEKLHSELPRLLDNTIIAISGIKVDVSKADSGPVTVTLELENTATGAVLVVGSDMGTVITEVIPGVKVSAKMDTIRTRGGSAEATFTIKEGFKGAFEVGQKI